MVAGGPAKALGLNFIESLDFPGGPLIARIWRLVPKANGTLSSTLSRIKTKQNPWAKTLPTDSIFHAAFSGMDLFPAGW
jgi:hypothetical protein